MDGLLTWILGGLIVGAIARFLIKGPHGFGCIGTILLGVVGSVVGGTLANVVTGNGFELEPAGFFGSVVGATILLAVAKRVSK